jgi:hypothetical protein
VSSAGNGSQITGGRRLRFCSRGRSGTLSPPARVRSSALAASHPAIVLPGQSRRPPGSTHDLGRPLVAIKRIRSHSPSVPLGYPAELGADEEPFNPNDSAITLASGLVAVALAS